MLDRRIIGKNFPPALNEIEKGAIRRYAEAIGETNPLYFDEQAALAAGYRGLLAPATFPATLTGGVDYREALGITQRSILIAEQSFEYYHPICAGDRLMVTTKIVDIFEKHGSAGAMDFAVIEDEGRDESGELYYRARRTIFARPLMRPEAAPTSQAKS
jgi:acyl dehydratase